MLRGRPALSQLPVIFLTSLSTERDRLLGYKLGVDDYVAKPHTPDDLLARTDRAVVRATQQKAAGADTGADGLRGDLEQVSLPSVLGFLEMERKTGILRIGPKTNARITLRDGKPIRVISPDVSAPSGARLLIALFDVTVGRFDFSAEEVEGDDEIGITLSGAMLEHARLHDEEVRDSLIGGEELE
jgi:hypothetical protein